MTDCTPNPMTKWDGPVPQREWEGIVSHLTLNACREKNLLFVNNDAPLELRRLSEFLKVCGELVTASSAAERVFACDQALRVICNLAIAVSKFADNVLPQGLDAEPNLLREKLQFQEVNPDLPHHTKGEEVKSRASGSTLSENKIAMPSGYGQSVLSRLCCGWLAMDTQTLIERIPNSAARLFFVGIASALIGGGVSFFTDNHIPKLLVVIGLAAMAIGQHVGETAISNRQS